MYVADSIFTEFLNNTEERRPCRMPLDFPMSLPHGNDPPFVLIVFQLIRVPSVLFVAHS
jgi:hypothetical protein